MPDDASYKWFILTPDILPAAPFDDAGVAIRWHQILAGFRWAGTTVADMVASLLNHPRRPRPKRCSSRASVSKFA